MIRKIVLIGAGNVATHLGQALSGNGREIIQVYSRSAESAASLAQILNCPRTTSLADIRADADLYLFAVNDDALAEVLRQFPHKQALVAHTSGSIPMEVFEAGFQNFAVFYPLQTFSKQSKPDYANIPLCLEANTPANYTLIEKLAQRVSNRVVSANSQQRRQLHLAAVFACNFTNHLYTIAADILEQHQLPFDILRPLISETAAKVQNNLPARVQTGPALRNNQQIIKAHLKALEALPDYQKIYTFITQSIIHSSK